MKTPKIFISSTYVDLAEVRKDIAKWLKGPFDTELVIMETFGSDAAPPEINSVRRVRECDLFIGIYAFRYGQIDESSGKSITELELEEAKASLSAGTMQDILLFMINKESEWLSEYKENKPDAIAGLERLRTRAKLHTYTLFNDNEDLLFFTTRDVFKRLFQILGSASPKIRKSVLVKKKQLSRPVGMEYLTAEYRDYFLGRRNELSSILNLIQKNPIVLLLGESGIGKTSLIHAGLLPVLANKQWRTVYTRPLGFPSTDINRQLLATVFEGQPFYKGPLVPLLGEISGAIQGQRLLLVVDQFEDILLSGDQNEVYKLLSDLRIIRTIQQPSISVLLSYRSDMEGRLGRFWQDISGSPLGLPRIYIQGISVDEAWEFLEISANSLKIRLEIRPAEIAQIKRDLISQSDILGYSGIYPPYVQMVLDHIWSSSHDSQYEFKDYKNIGSIDEIIAGYLTRQMKYTKDPQGKVRSILVSLVRSYGVKAQKELPEISEDTGFPETTCEQALEKLIDLRLVRHIPPYYEISHDFIARRIASELIDSEEREFKRFRELLTTKTAAFRTTGSLLTNAEQLMLYKHRRKLIPSDEELQLILSTWAHSGGPGLYWLISAEKPKILSWLSKEDQDNSSDDAKGAIVLLRHKIDGLPLTESDYHAFRNFQLSAELSSIILETAKTIPTNEIIYGLRHRREEVRESCIFAIVERIKCRDFNLLESLSRSRSSFVQDAFEELVLMSEVPIYETGTNMSKTIKEFFLLKKIVATPSLQEAIMVYRELKKNRLRNKIQMFASSLLAAKKQRVEQLLKRSKNRSIEVARISIKSIRCISSSEIFKKLLNAYCEWNRLERAKHTPSINAKAKILSANIQRMMRPEFIGIIMDFFHEIQMTPSSREIVHVILKFGSENNLKIVFDKIEKEDSKIDYWNHTAVGKAAYQNSRLKGKGIPKFLRQIISTKEFKEYIFPTDRKKSQKHDLLPLATMDNKALYIRLAAYTAISAADRNNVEYLLELTTHQYSLIAQAAAIKLINLFENEALQMLSDKIDEAILSGKIDHIYKALQYAEMQFYSLIDLNRIQVRG